MAYEIILRLKEQGDTNTLSLLKKAVTTKDRNNGHLHEVWKESFDWEYCETAAFTYQKLLYIHKNPCSGKWNLAADITKYEHSSARYYVSGKHAGYAVKDVEEVLKRIMERRGSSIKRPASLQRTRSGEETPVGKNLMPSKFK